MTTAKDEILRRRDSKVRTALTEAAPCWLIGEQVREGEDSVLFNLVYEHRTAGWINERFKYDAFADVLYHMGSKTIPETELIQIMDQTPYIDADFNRTARIAPAPRGT